ncbi:MAG: Uncharacterized protein JWN48_4768 [Myxococcaceae bacterium]|nr:Uncharacterized protein [Myxococcaceae bacterium]
MSEEQHLARIDRAWDRVVRWCQTHAPQTAALLRPAPSDAEIEDAERATGVAWPLELKRWYKLQGGLGLYEFEAEIFPGFAPVSLEALVESYQRVLEIWFAQDWEGRSIEERMAIPITDWSGTYLPSYLPFAEDGCGNMLLLDARGGLLSGPVREWDKVEADRAGVRWSSLAELLEDVATALEQQRPAQNGLAPRAVEGALEWDLPSYWAR